jgi:hypothetical protein
MRRSREEFLKHLHAACPHHIDLIPPPNGYGQRTEEEIYEFLDARIGAMDMYGAIQDGVMFIRYCFLKEEDASLFREKFARIGTIINFPKAASG